MCSLPKLDATALDRLDKGLAALADLVSELKRSVAAIPAAVPLAAAASATAADIVRRADWDRRD